MNWAELSRALHSKCGFEVRTANDDNPRQLRMLGRAPKERMGDMLLLVNTLKMAEEQGAKWTCDISKMYLRRNGKVLYAWRFIFQAEDVSQQINDIIRAVSKAPKSSRRELEEVPLIGVSADRNAQGANGKGAGFLGQIKIGPQLKGS